MLEDNSGIAREIAQSLEKAKERQQQKKERMLEEEDPPEKVEAKIQQLLRLVLDTAAGIPDFRGPKGVWTLQGEGRWEEAAAAMGRKYEEASPTVAHMAVAALVRAEIVQHVVTQNVDGLHSRSGIPSDRLSELHGSVYRESCRECGAKYVRPFDVTAARGSSYHRHKTGRLCTAVTGAGTGAAACDSGAGTGAAACATGDDAGASKSAHPTVDVSAREECNEREGNEEEEEEEEKQRRVPSAQNPVRKPRSSAAVRARMSTGGGGGVKEESQEVLVGNGRKRHEPGKASFELTQKSAQMSTGGGGSVKEENHEVLLGERRKWREPGAATLEDSEGTPRVVLRDHDEDKEGDDAQMDDEGGVRRWREAEEKQQGRGGEEKDEVTRECERRGAREEEQGEVTKEGEEDGEEEGGGERHEGGAVCGGELVDSIVHFGERIDDEELRTAREACMCAHVALCLGSSFKVPPASKLPRLATHIVIINLQRTPLDRHASITIRARIDAVLPRLLHLLHLPLPTYHRHSDPLLLLLSTALHSLTHGPHLPLSSAPPLFPPLKLSTQPAEEKGKGVTSESPQK
ncbi:unnamed protein product, partial [Closterium sp. Naga37s-1]